MERSKQQHCAAPWQAELERRAALQLYPPGITLLRQGAAAQEVYVLRRGLVKLTHAAANGREIILGLRAAESWLGGEVAVLQATALCSAITLTECELYRVPVAVYLDWFKNDPHFAWQRHESQCRELVGQLQHAVDLICATARQRLEQALWQMARAQTTNQRNVRLQLPLQQQELASLIAVTPSHLSRMFGELERDKLLRRDKGWLVIPAPDKLWRAYEPVAPARPVRRTR